jgi:hypothetical protein
MAAELSAAAAQEEDTERKGLLSYAARLIGDTLRDVAVRAAGQVLSPSTDRPAPGRASAATLPFGDDLRPAGPAPSAGAEAG